MICEWRIKYQLLWITFPSISLFSQIKEENYKKLCYDLKKVSNFDNSFFISPSVHLVQVVEVAIRDALEIDISEIVVFLNVKSVMDAMLLLSFPPSLISNGFDKHDGSVIFSISPWDLVKRVYFVWSSFWHMLLHLFNANPSWRCF